MNEIKFRIWDKLNRCMIYFNLDSIKNNIVNLATLFAVLKNPHEKMLFVDKKDKTGRDAYDGDIFKIPSGNPEDPNGWLGDAPEYFGVIMFGEYEDEDSGEKHIGFYGYDPSDKICYPLISIEDKIIVGNIYENKNILIKKKYTLKERLDFLKKHNAERIRLIDFDKKKHQEISYYFDKKGLGLARIRLSKDDDHINFTDFIYSKRPKINIKKDQEKIFFFEVEGKEKLKCYKLKDIYVDIIPKEVKQ